MAMFRIMRGLEEKLPQQLNPGTMYFTTDTYKIFIDMDDQRLLLSKGEPVPIYPNDVSNPYADSQNSSSYLPGYQEVKEY